MPAWQGENLGGKRLLVYAEQGAGDTIQFARYVPLLVQQGARVILECPRALVALLRTLPGVEQVIARGEALPPVDLQCALLRFALRSLVFGLHHESRTFPAGVPYLQGRADGPPITGLHLRDRRALGPRHEMDSYGQVIRNIKTLMPDDLISPRGPLPRPWVANQEAVFYSLQPKPRSVAGQYPQADDLATDLTALIGDYADTACLLRQLDLVISVDTSVAHLAGALGHPVWLLLPFAPDWRWLVERDDSPWYPSMRIVSTTRRRRLEFGAPRGQRKP